MEVFLMKKYPIDKMLCALERRADLVGAQIDENSDYVFICEALGAFEVNGGAVSYEFKEQIYFRLRKLFQEFNLDFGAMMAQILLGE
jgi:hypothetical protein